MDMKKFLEELEILVNIDCGSYTPEGVNKVTEYFKQELNMIGNQLVEYQMETSQEFQELELLMQLDQLVEMLTVEMNF